MQKQSGWAFSRALLPDMDATSPHDIPEKRKAFLCRLMQVCDQLRAARGNSGISTAGFYLDPKANFSGGTSVWSAGGVSVYSPDNSFEHSS